MNRSSEHVCIVIGAGPAGLTAAYELGRAGIPGVVFESGRSVGGLARTAEFDGYRLDIGGHRFFTKIDSIHDLWQEALGDEFLPCTRLSRIHYNGKFFHYPLKPLNILSGLGAVESARIILSYCRTLASTAREENNLEQWVSNRFGTRLYEIFFKTYTEKVWGISCSELSAEWASQRLRNLDLVSALKNALLGSSRRKSSMITSLIERFHYPRLGPGMMWERFSALAAEKGVDTILETSVCRVHRDGGRVVGVTVRDRAGEEQRHGCDHLISSMPLRTLVESFEPAPPAEVVAAADQLRYRDFLTVGLIVDKAEIFPDNWIYIHSPEVRVGRIQNFKNWSAAMVPDPAKTLLGLEYFVSAAEEFWHRSDAELIELGAEECEALGFIRADQVSGGMVIRQLGAYPVYAGPYKESLRVIRQWLGEISNLQTIGRNGQHRYNNMDHSMLTAISAVGRISGRATTLAGAGAGSEYLEEARTSTPAGRRRRPAVTARIIARAFARCDPVALGTAIGSVLSLALLVISIVMLVSAEPADRVTFSLLANYFIGYRASLAGTLIGVGEMAVAGFIYGWGLGQLVNLLIGGYEAALRREIEMARAMDEIDLPTELRNESG